MKNILTLQDNDFDSSVPKAIESEYWLREAARAVLFSPDGEIYLMHVTKHGYHKLPGGGIDTGESKEQALHRELLEEVGCRAKIQHELGQITEYRKFLSSQKQISYCYTATQVDVQQDSALEEGELEEGMIEVKAKNLTDAIRILKADTPDNLEGQFIQKRDLAFLEAALGRVK